MELQAAEHDRRESRPSIAFLLWLTAAVGISITITRGLELLRSPADQFYYGIEPTKSISTTSLLVAILYGLCLTTFLFAGRGNRLWESPGKVLSLFFAAMCVVDWGLSAIAYGIVAARIIEFDGVNYPNGYVLGIWYGQFAPAIGYLLSLPMLVVFVLKTKSQGVSWCLVWIGFALFAMLILGNIFAALGERLPPTLIDWYFEIAVGIPLCGVAFAMFHSVLRRERNDWWTIAIGSTLLAGWVLTIGVKAASKLALI